MVLQFGGAKSGEKQILPRAGMNCRREWRGGEGGKIGMVFGKKWHAAGMCNKRLVTYQKLRIKRRTRSSRPTQSQITPSAYKGNKKSTHRLQDVWTRSLFDPRHDVPKTVALQKVSRV